MVIPHFDLIELIKTFGYLGLSFVIFAESGLFFGFFLPGDSLLFTAGILASQGFLNIWVLLPLMAVCAIGGDSVGYWFGRKLGSWLLRQEDTWYFKKKHLHQAQKFYEKHGGKTLILARFMPAVRTFAPIVAGMADMHYETFLSYNVVGGLLWATGLTLLGYLLGNVIPNVDRYLLPIVGLIAVVSVVPALLHMRGGKQQE
ncbi:MAG TPA: VTT domain-containing protein [Candidatus Saccharimonadia bacterium]|nr:VTT domain-containing protein [Candidatus Saccharimonadia bacterium]